MESFFATLKKEKIYRISAYKLTRDQVKTVIFRYVFIYYNRIRVYTSNPNGLPPTAYREWAARVKQTDAASVFLRSATLHSGKRMHLLNFFSFWVFFTILFLTSPIRAKSNPEIHRRYLNLKKRRNHKKAIIAIARMAVDRYLQHSQEE